MNTEIVLKNSWKFFLASWIVCFIVGASLIAVSWNISIAVVTMSSIYLYLSIKHYVTNCNANPFLKNRDEGFMIPALSSPLGYFAVKYDLNIFYSLLTWTPLLIHTIYIVTLKAKKIIQYLKLRANLAGIK